MRKNILLCSLLLLPGITAVARTLSPSEALSRACGVSASRSVGGADPVMTIGDKDAPTMYVFNRPDEGWIIVSADDVAAPVIGYSNTGKFDTENLPENLKGWLELCSDEISAASAAGATAYGTVSRAGDLKTPIEPLVKTKWNQNSPFNNSCPTGCYTGCVATAMAQVMKYHNWPEKAGENAKFSYKLDSQTLTADFSNYEFDWDNMLDEYQYGGVNAVQDDAVAKLMQACGYSVRMRYSNYASAAYSEQVGGALVSYFNYDGGLHNEFRNLYSSTEWEDMIYDNLRDVGPMVYWGGAHCFVCDGYSSNGYFHFNWGWSGLHDGYFLLTALAPGGGGIGSGTGDYTQNQGVLLGIKPSTGAETQRHYTFRIDELTDASVGQLGLTITGLFVNCSPYTVSGKFIYQVYDITGTEKITTCPVYSPACNNWGIDISTGWTVTAPRMSAFVNGLSDGKYRVYPAVEIDGVEYSFMCPPTVAGYVIVTSENGRLIDAEVPSAGELMVENLDTHGDFYVRSKIKISGTAIFTGISDTNVSVTACLLREDGSVRANSTSTLTLNFSEDGAPFEFVIPWFENDKSLTVTAGDYRFGIAIIENGLYKILGSCPVKVHDQVVTPTFDVNMTVGNADAVNPDDIKVSATFTGTNGVFDSYLNFQIYKGTGSLASNYIKNQFVDDIYINAGQTVSTELTFSLPDALPGETYNVVLRNSSYKELCNAVFTIGESTGIEHIGADNDSKAEYFNLQGQPVNGDNLLPGIYILRKGTETRKVIIE